VYGESYRQLAESPGEQLLIRSGCVWLLQVNISYPIHYILFFPL